MKKSGTMKILILIVLIFFILSTGLMFVLYLASPSTVLDLEGDQNIEEIMGEEVNQNNEGVIEEIQETAEEENNEANS